MTDRKTETAAELGRPKVTVGAVGRVLQLTSGAPSGAGSVLLRSGFSARADAADHDVTADVKVTLDELPRLVDPAAGIVGGGSGASEVAGIVAAALAAEGWARRAAGPKPDGESEWTAARILWRSRLFGARAVAAAPVLAEGEDDETAAADAIANVLAWVASRGVDRGRFGAILMRASDNACGEILDAADEAAEALKEVGPAPSPCGRLECGGCGEAPPPRYGSAVDPAAEADEGDRLDLAPVPAWEELPRYVAEVEETAPEYGRRRAARPIGLDRRRCRDGAHEVTVYVRGEVAGTLRRRGSGGDPGAIRVWHAGRRVGAYHAGLGGFVLFRAAVRAVVEAAERDRAGVPAWAPAPAGGLTVREAVPEYVPHELSDRAAFAWLLGRAGAPAHVAAELLAWARAAGREDEARCNWAPEVIGGVIETARRAHERGRAILAADWPGAVVRRSGNPLARALEVDFPAPTPEGRTSAGVPEERVRFSRAETVAFDRAHRARQDGAGAVEEEAPAYGTGPEGVAVATCRQCGGVDVQATDWVHANTGEVIGGGLADDDDNTFCSTCDDSGLGILFVYPATPEQLAAIEALKPPTPEDRAEDVLARIAARMSGRTWDADTAADVAEILRGAGCTVEEVREDRPVRWGAYLYPNAERYILRRDGREVFRGSEGACWAYMHRHTAASVSHALAHEGWSMEPATDAGGEVREDPPKYATAYGRAVAAVAGGMPLLATGARPGETLSDLRRRAVREVATTRRQIGYATDEDARRAWREHAERIEAEILEADRVRAATKEHAKRRRRWPDGVREAPAPDLRCNTGARCGAPATAFCRAPGRLVLACGSHRAEADALMLRCGLRPIPWVDVLGVDGRAEARRLEVLERGDPWQPDGDGFTRPEDEREAEQDAADRAAGRQ